ncbi:MAG: TonB-dependent receptor [Bacteroidales bacterium]|nr:TonB-dependent receptor [Bacteroidales bacterium]
MLTALLSLSILIQAPDTLDASVVRAQRRVSPPVEKATREVLERAANLAEAIRDFSGVQLRDYGGAGGLKTVNIRSLGSAHTAIFLDGVPIDNAQNMQPDLGRLDVEDLETVELYTGQKSQLLQSAREYGSASSLHMTTAVPKARKTSMRLRGGSFGTVSPSISHEGRIAGAFTGRIRLGGDFSQGNYPFHVTGQDYDTVMVRENGDIKAFKASGGLWYTPTGGRYHLSARLYDSERGIPGPVYKQSKEYPMSLDRQADRSFTVQASGEQELSPTVSILARARYSRDLLKYLDISELDPSVSAQWDYDLLSTYVSTALGWQVLPWLHISGALDAQHDALESRVDASRTSLFTAVSAALLKDPWRASATLQYQSTDDGYSFLSPALLLNWHPRRDWEFGATVKRSCRLPSFNDLYYTNVTSRSLLPEKVWQMSARWCWDRSYGPWHLRANEELYHNRVTDKLIAVPNGSLFRWSMYNLGKVSIWGDEIHADISWNNALGIIARYSFQWAREDGKAFQIPYIPLHSASFNLYGALDSWRVDLKGFLTAARLTAASSRPEYRLSPWTTWDASLSWRPATRNSRLRPGVSIDVRNILNEQYQIVQGYPMPGISVFISTFVQIK